ncbi:MAG: hypothetical protein LC667_04900 [Thioalkalivibrio sp.]|nr:hypothetical protein [Thioalkalivibrio sp.]
MLAKQWGAASTHGSMAELGDNLVRALAEEPPRHFHQTSWIIGHGNEGYVDVGQGQMGRSWLRSIDRDNEEVWGPQFERIRTEPRVIQTGLGPTLNYRSVWFLSCSTAAGSDGFWLLQRIADIGNLQVTAHTGLLYVNDRSMSFEPGSRQVCVLPRGHGIPERAHPCRLPGPWSAPQNPEKSIGELKMTAMGFSPGMEAEDVTSVIVADQEGRTTEFPADEAGPLLRMLFATGPFTTDGQIAGAVTAHVSVRYRSQPALEVDLVVDRIAMTSTGLSFFTAQGIEEVLVRSGARFRSSQ